ncbi:MAG TPA: hypothetical protein VHH36_01590 [Candidatus Thermoplasmatota archaeon]|nr:hypothetical protein [Candidatus Thermoplasmatota archaeon]
MADPPAPPARPDLYVVARFLDRLAEPGAAYTRSRLQLAVRLNYDLFRSYLALLQRRGLVEVVEVGGREVVRATPAGVEADRELGAWIRRMLDEGP